MYLAGVIPGPKHPSKDQINRILEVVLEPFRESYKRSVFYSSTPSYPDGRKTVSIVVPLVADTLSAHQMNGNASFNHTYGCPFCELASEDLEDLNFDQWPKRTAAQTVEIARRWLSAKTVVEQEAIYAAHGIRWSAMLTLPYWDPVAFLAVDLMHNLFLGKPLTAPIRLKIGSYVGNTGVVKTHFYHIWIQLKIFRTTHELRQLHALLVQVRQD